MNDSTPHETSDDEVLRALAAAFDDDLPAVPQAVHAAALEAFRWRSGDDLLAELLFDSGSEQGARQLEGAARGNATTRRSVRFGAGPVQVELSIGETETLVSLHPPAALACVVESPAGSREFTADGNGSFAADGIAVPVRVRVRTTEGTFVTPWVIG